MKIRFGWTKNEVEMPDAVERLMRGAFPGYRGRKFRVMPERHVCMSDTYWDGGSRSQYVIVRLSDGRQMAVPDLISGGYLPTAGAAMRTMGSWDLPEGFVVVRHGISCGKDVGLTLSVRPDELPRMLPASAPVLALTA